jgi:hypothetical protein
MFDDTKLETWIVDSELWRRWRRSWGWGRGHLGYFHISIFFFFAVATVQPTLSTSLFFPFFRSAGLNKDSTSSYIQKYI